LGTQVVEALGWEVEANRQAASGWGVVHGKTVDEGALPPEKTDDPKQKRFVPRSGEPDHIGGSLCRGLAHSCLRAEKRNDPPVREVVSARAGGSVR
jgi:hypothetical protein